jgi:hypothetical protein
MNKILRALSPNIADNQYLTSVKLVGVFISVGGWQALATGVRENTTVRDITINFCRLNDEGLIHLAPAIGFNVRALDLSNNEIAERGAWELGKMLQKHAEYRDNKVWMSGLR